MKLPNSLSACTGKGVKVCVIDSGINPKSSAAKNVRKGIGIGFKNGKTYTYRYIDDENGHGTRICEIITANAPDVELYIAKIFKERLINEMECLVKGIEWAVKNKVNIINISLGTTWTRNVKELRSACLEAHRKNILIVSSLDSRNRISYPGWFKEVFCVYNENYSEIKRKKQYLFALKNGCKMKSGNSILVPIITSGASLVVESNKSINSMTIFLKLYSYFHHGAKI